MNDPEDCRNKLVYSRFHETLPLRLLHFEELQSTNVWCEENVETLVSSYGLSTTVGIRVSTTHQTQGIGQRITSSSNHSDGITHRRWHSGDGNMYVTFVFLVPSQDVHKIVTLPLLMGMAVVRALHQYNVSAKVKWPNDVVVDRKKISGILCRCIPLSLSSFSKTLVLCIGIGLNVKCSPHIPLDLEDNHEQLFPTCLREIISQHSKNNDTSVLCDRDFSTKDTIQIPSADDVLKILTPFVYEYVKDFSAREFSDILPRLYKSLYGYQMPVKLTIQNERGEMQCLVARLTGLDPTTGALMFVEEESIHHFTILPSRLVVQPESSKSVTVQESDSSQYLVSFTTAD